MHKLVVSYQKYLSPHFKATHHSVHTLTPRTQATMRFAAALLLPIAATTAFAPNAVHDRQRMALSAFWDKVSENNA